MWGEGIASGVGGNAATLGWGRTVFFLSMYLVILLMLLSILAGLLYFILIMIKETLDKQVVHT